MSSQSSSNKNKQLSACEPVVKARQVQQASERAFGILFAIIFGLVALWPVVMYGTAPYGWAAVVAVVFAGFAWLVPHLLAPLNRLWMRFGALLHRIINPLVLGAIYYGVVTPTGLLMRLFGKDVLSLRTDPKQQSYWIVRDPPGPDKGSMSNQF